MKKLNFVIAAVCMLILAGCAQKQPPNIKNRAELHDPLSSGYVTTDSDGNLYFSPKLSEKLNNKK